MANKKLIEEMKYLHKKASEITPAVYASIAIVLVEEMQWNANEVEWLFQRSQDVWQNNVYSKETMLEHCEKLTGIDLRCN